MPKLVVASYCTTFLKSEMLHIYRQVTALREVQTFVMTKKLQNEERFPFDDIELVHGEATARLLLHEVRAAEVVEVSVGHDAPVDGLVPDGLREDGAHDGEAERQIAARCLDPGAAVEEVREFAVPWASVRPGVCCCAAGLETKTRHAIPTTATATVT